MTRDKSYIQSTKSSYVRQENKINYLSQNVYMFCNELENMDVIDKMASYTCNVIIMLLLLLPETNGLNMIDEHSTKIYGCNGVIQ